jgi:F-type H+-transporting ATPase subunit gamma
MELVSASKMKKAVFSTLASRLYAEYSWNILTSIGENLETIKNVLFSEREVKKILLILISSNRGLCGAYNAQIIKKTILLLKTLNEKAEIEIVTVGKKGDLAMRRVGQNIIANFLEIPDNISLADIIPISNLAISEFNLSKCDQVFIAYTDFISPLVQKPNIKKIIPISKNDLRDLIDNLGNEIENEKKEEKNQKINYLFEGNQEILIQSLAEKLIRMQIYQMMLESNASEQSARMMAMKNASEAAGEMIDDLTLVFNKARQAGITREISEISAGMASIN